MKTVILMRHSQAEQTSSLPNWRIPLTEEGIRRGKSFFQKKGFEGIERVCASPYRRAYQTAHLLSAAVLLDKRLVERRLGDEDGLDADFWEKQYQDHEFKNRNGESLNEAGGRIDEFVGELLDDMRDGESALVVTHAAAICGYLMKYCEIAVTDAEKKLRRIRFAEKTVLDGKIETPSAFILKFEGRALKDIRYIE